MQNTEYSWMPQRTFLPLATPSGDPFWYITTDKMVSASTRLSEAAGTAIPAGAALMRTMAIEAQSSALLDNAESHSAGVEKALSYAIANLGRPITEASVGEMMRMITETAAFYRTPQSALQMRRLCQFLGDSQYHPLVKSAVAHAVVLHIQPFPVANGRLARLLALCILVRSGYGFMLGEDSFSVALSRNGLQYAQETRTGISGALTSFIEFQMQAMVDILDGIAAQPRGPDTERAEKAGRLSNADEPKNGPILTIPADSRIITAPYSEVGFCLKLAEMEAYGSDSVRHAASCVRELLNAGIWDFCSVDWTDRFDDPYRVFNQSVWTLRRRGMVEITDRNDRQHYRFNATYLLQPAGKPEQLECPYRTMDPNTFWQRLAILRNSWSPLMKRLPEIVAQMITEGKMEYTSPEWMERSGMSYADYTSCKVSMQRLGLIVNMAIYDYSISPRFPIHRFTLRNDISTTPKAARVSTRPANNPYFVNRDFWACLEKISNDPSPTQQRTLEIILDMIDHNIFDFTAKEMREKTGMSKKEFNGVRECMKRNGLISVKSNEAGMIPRRCVLVRYRLTVPLPIHSERSKIQPLSEKPVRIPASAILSPDVFWGRIDRMEKSRSLPISQGATIIRRMIENGITTYTRRSFMAYSGMSGDEYARCRPGITDRGLVYDLTNERRTGPQRPGIYAFTLAGLKLSKDMPLNSRTTQKEKNRLPAK